jgi:hypothetical protein
MNCSCPNHWVLCLKLDCPRAAVIRQQQREAFVKAQAFLGDPRIGVSFPILGGCSHEKAEVGKRCPNCGVHILDDC